MYKAIQQTLTETGAESRHGGGDLSDMALFKTAIS